PAASAPAHRDDHSDCARPEWYRPPVAARCGSPPVPGAGSSAGPPARHIRSDRDRSGWCARPAAAENTHDPATKFCSRHPALAIAAGIRPRESRDRRETDNALPAAAFPPENALLPAPVRGSGASPAGCPADCESRWACDGIYRGRNRDFSYAASLPSGLALSLWMTSENFRYTSLGVRMPASLPCLVTSTDPRC